MIFDYGSSIFEIILKIVIEPINIPAAPNPMAKIKNFFFSIIYYHMLFAFIIARVPSSASSKRTVSVA